MSGTGGVVEVELIVAGCMQSTITAILIRAFVVDVRDERQQMC